MTNWYEKFKESMGEAIANGWDLRAVNTANSAREFAGLGRITRAQADEIQSMYDTWVATWDAESAAVETATRAALERAGMLAEEAPAPESDPQDAAPVKVYSNQRTDECTGSAVVAMGWHRAGDAVEVHTRDAYWGELLHRVTITGAPQEAPRTAADENRAHCKHIADELDAYVNGELKRCPDCGEIHRRDWDDILDTFRCPNCGSVGSVDDWDTLSIWEFFDDALDIEYRVGSDREYRSVCVMVTWGGPNIYVDTETKNVELYWWGDRASYPISYDAVNIIDEWAEEYWNL